MSNKVSVERSRTSTNNNCTDACDPHREEEDETFSVDRQLRNLRSTVQYRTVSKDNDESPVVEKKRCTRETEGESEGEFGLMFQKFNNHFHFPFL